MTYRAELDAELAGIRMERSDIAWKLNNEIGDWDALNARDEILCAEQVSIQEEIDELDAEENRRDGYSDRMAYQRSVL